MNLAAFDLNLLVALDALLAERSVTKAARRLGLSQPATSNALTRLRRAFGDPLLVRTRHGMAPTPRALTLAGPVRASIVDLLHGVSGAARFDPRTATRTFTIAASDYGETLLLMGIVQRLSRVAPRLALHVVPLEAELSASHLELGAIDLAIGHFPAGLGAEHEALLEDRLVCVARRDHPGLRGRLDLDRLVRLDGVVVAPRGEARGLLDEALAQRGLVRRTALRVPHFLIALSTVAQTDLVAVLPEKLARALAPALALRVAELPIELPRIRLSQVWHARDDKDPAHAWFRGLVRAVAIQRVNGRHHQRA